MILIIKMKKNIFEYFSRMDKVIWLFFLLFFLNVNDLLSQTWNATVTRSDFDGLVRKMEVIGSGGESPYTSPTLSIKRDNAGITFQIDGIGYTGCDFNNVYFVFDGIRRYKTMLVRSNEDKSGLKMKEFAMLPRTFHFDYFQIFNEMSKSQRMSVRVENSCYKRDYFFNLDGFDSSFNRLFSKEEISLSEVLFHSHSDIYNRFVNAQKKYSSISTFWRDNISKCDFQVSQDGEHTLYLISDRTIEDILTVFYVYNNDILKEADALWPDKVRYTVQSGELVKRTTTGQFHPTGYKVILDGDSLKLDYSPFQKAQFNIYNSYGGLYKEGLANFIFLLTNDELPDYQHNLNPELIDEIARRVDYMGNGNNFKSFRVRMTSKRKAIVEYQKIMEFYWKPVPGLEPFIYSIGN